jgi:hypothetical protein
LKKRLFNKFSGNSKISSILFEIVAFVIISTECPSSNNPLVSGTISLYKSVSPCAVKLMKHSPPSLSFDKACTICSTGY